MARYIMTADLRRCIGCQTCTAACRHAQPVWLLLLAVSRSAPPLGAALPSRLSWAVLEKSG